jgi:5-methylcytosine-specific restriction endonuclease McrA
VASDISEELRAEVARRAGRRCEYCLIQEDDAGFPHQIDHIVSRKHGGSSTSDNLAYACVVCNRHKGSEVASIGPRTGQAVRLFDPRRDRWADHFRLDGALIEPVSSVGSATAQLLRLNSPERISERRLLQSLGRYRRR